MKLTASTSVFIPKFRLLLLIVCLSEIKPWVFTYGEKLSPDQKAPLFAQGAGGLRLDLPLEGPVKTYASILKEKSLPNLGNGEYSFSFETEDGVQREEIGTLKMVGEELVTVVQGRYSYTSPEGLAIDVQYTADENGARSRFSFGTDPGRWRQSLSLPELPKSGRSHEDKGKSVSGIGGETGRGYLPPSQTKKINNDYLPQSPSKKLAMSMCHRLLNENY